MEELDLSREIDKILLNSNRSKEIKSGEEVDKLSKKTFLGVPTKEFGLKDCVFQGIPIEDVLMGFSISGGCVVFSKNKFCISDGMSNKYNVFPIDDFVKLSIERDGITSESVFLNGKRVGNFNRQSIDPWKRISDEINTFFKDYFDLILKEEQIRLQEKQRLKEEQRQQKLKEKRERLEEEKKLRDQQKHFKNLERKKVLQEGVTKFINEFDSDKDGIIDFNQGEDDFMNLLKKHQKTIVQVDQNHITKLIQVSNYLKTKRGNIQTQFEKIKNSRNSKQLNEFSGILKNQIDTFNLLNYNSLIIIISLVEGDLITFNEIYLTFDKLNIFNSNWENQVSDKLNNIDSKLDEVIYSINKMELSIVNEILGMSIMNQVQMNRLNKNVKEGNMMIDENLSRLNSSLSSNLKSIDSTLKVGNLISTINTYQNYKINKNTKSLRG